MIISAIHKSAVTYREFFELNRKVAHYNLERAQRMTIESVTEDWMVKMVGQPNVGTVQYWYNAVENGDIYITNVSKLRNYKGFKAEEKVEKVKNEEVDALPLREEMKNITAELRELRAANSQLSDLVQRLDKKYDHEIVKHDRQIEELRSQIAAIRGKLQGNDKEDIKDYVGGKIYDMTNYYESLVEQLSQQITDIQEALAVIDVHVQLTELQYKVDKQLKK